MSEKDATPQPPVKKDPTPHVQAKKDVPTPEKPAKQLTPAKSAKPFTGKKVPTAPEKTTSGPSSAAKQGENAEAATTATTLEDLEKAVEKMETKFKTINANNIARVANSHVSSSEGRLQALSSLKTGNPLEKFPETPKDMLKLKLLDIDAMLKELEADRAGNEEVKRGNLRLQIGLPQHPA